MVGDYEVSPILWEVRRERRIELVYEGIRFDDIRRWGKLHYADMKINKKLNLGAWLDKEAYLKEYNQANGTSYTIDDLKDILLDREGNSGYIKPTRFLHYCVLMEKKIIFILSRQDRYPCITVRVNNWEILY